MEVIQNSDMRDPSPFSEIGARSKLPPESHTGPWLVFIHDHKQENRQIFFSISEDSFYVKSIDDMEKHDCWPTVQGWVLMKKPNSHRCFLMNPTSLEKIELQPLACSLDRKCKCILSAPPDDPNFMVLIANYNNSCLYFCLPRDPTGNQYWKRYKYEKDRLLDIVALNGTFYACYYKRFAMLRYLPNPSFVLFEDLMTELIVGLKYYSKDFMLVSCGDIFFVKCFMDKSTSFGKKVIHVEVYKRNSITFVWNKVDNIGDRVFFIDGNSRFSASWSSTELGVKENCIYITMEDDKHMYVFDMEEGTMCIRLPCPSSWKNCSQPFWMMVPV